MTFDSLRRTTLGQMRRPPGLSPSCVGIIPLRHVVSLADRPKHVVHDVDEHPRIGRRLALGPFELNQGQPDFQSLYVLARHTGWPDHGATMNRCSASGISRTLQPPSSRSVSRDIAGVVRQRVRVSFAD
jgi:hypothetical protein